MNSSNTTRNRLRTHLRLILQMSLAVGWVLGGSTFAAPLVQGQTPASAHFVQWTAGDAGGAASDTTRFGRPATSGNMIVALAHWNDQDVMATVSDSRGNKYVPLSAPMNSGPTERFQAWFAKDVHGGPDLSVTINFSKKTRTFSVINALEYTGIDKASPLIASAAATGNGNTQSSGALKVDGSKNCVLLGLFGYSHYALPYTAGPGFVMDAYEASTVMEAAGCGTLRTPAATATSSNPADWAAIGAAFRTAAASPKRP